MLSKDYEGVNHFIHPMKRTNDAIEAAQPTHSQHFWWLNNAVVAPLPVENLSKLFGKCMQEAAGNYDMC